MTEDEVNADDREEPYDDEIYEEDKKEDDEIIRAKWSMDGATTLLEAAEMLRESATRLEQLHAAGWKLRNPVDGDYGFIYQEVTPQVST